MLVKQIKIVKDANYKDIIECPYAPTKEYIIELSPKPPDEYSTPRSTDRSLAGLDISHIR